MDSVTQAHTNVLEVIAEGGDPTEAQAAFNEAVNSQQENIDTQITELNEQIEAGQTQITELQSQVEELTNTNAELQSTIEQTNQQIEELQASNETAQERITELEEANQVLSQETDTPPVEVETEVDEDELTNTQLDGNQIWMKALKKVAKPTEN